METRSRCGGKSQHKDTEDIQGLVSQKLVFFLPSSVTILVNGYTFVRTITNYELLLDSCVNENLTGIGQIVDSYRYIEEQLK